MSAGGTWRVPTAEENRSCGGRGLVQHTTHRGQGTVVESGQRTSLKNRFASASTDTDLLALDLQVGPRSLP